VAGNGNWENPNHWVTLLDPAYRIINAQGQVVNGLPTTPQLGLGGTGGDFGSVAGTARTNGLVWYTGVYGTVPNGLGFQSAQAEVSALRYRTGTLWIGGLVGTAGGTVISVGRAVVQYNGAGVFGTVRGGSITGNDVYALAFANGTLIVGGNLSAAGGTIVQDIAYNDGTNWGTFTGGGISTGVVGALAVDLRQQLWVGGTFDAVGGIAARNIVQAQSQFWRPSGLGLAAGPVWAIDAQPDGQVMAGGNIQSVASGASAVTQTITGGIARWTGGAWVNEALSMAVSVGQPVRVFHRQPNGTIWAGGDFTGTAHTTAQAQVVNGGMAPVRPVFRLRHTAATGTTTVRRIANATTDTAIYLDLPCSPNEIITFDLSGPVATLTSTTAGNQFNRILEGSDLSNFRLLSGTNAIQTFADGDNLEIAIYWRPQHSSADGGTVL
jgi:hypothetical protein